MKKRSTTYLSVLCLLLYSCENKHVEKRNPLQWPFSQASIWNMPVGSEARYVHARIEQSTARGMTVDEDIIVMTPDEPLMDIFKNHAGWDRTKNRCEIQGEKLFSAPIPKNFIVSPDTWDGLTPNSGLAVLMPDGETIKQTQPFAHCSAIDSATSKYVFEDVNLYEKGIYGAHGGSGLSVIGGTLRLGELTPSSGTICHVLKVNIFAKKNLFYDENTKGYRWPAIKADGYAKGNYYSQRTLKQVKACRMGALLALPKWMDLDSLQFETQPALILARTFQDYGAYVVDDTAWDVYAIVTEWSPKGRFTEEFERNWGFPMDEKSKDSPWGRDMDRIFTNLHVVDNNAPNRIGGGGTALAPLAPQLRKKN
jgi:hypothetical protein